MMLKSTGLIKRFNAPGRGARRSSRRFNRKAQSGQGLVEYALIMVLVAIVSIAAAFLIGLAVQRVYGVVVGMLGTKYGSTVNGHYLEIDQAQCWVIPEQHITGLWVTGFSNEDVSMLTGSTESQVGTGIGGGASPVEVNGSAGFKFHPLLSETTADASLCPKAAVIQSKNGPIAVAPVTVQ